MPTVKEVEHADIINCEINQEVPSVGDPNDISLPNSASEIYQSTVPTYAELCGVNVNRGNERHFEEMAKLSEVFSHARTFHFMNKDYWDDGIGQANGSIPSTLRRYTPKEYERLKLLVDKNGLPLMRNEWKEGDRMIVFDSQKEALTENGGK